MGHPWAPVAADPLPCPAWLCSEARPGPVPVFVVCPARAVLRERLCPRPHPGVGTSTATAGGQGPLLISSPRGPVAAGAAD